MGSVAVGLSSRSPARQTLERAAAAAAAPAALAEVTSSSAGERWAHRRTPQPGQTSEDRGSCLRLLEAGRLRPRAA
eukprot:CAMPEP_0197890350 /NCGR_PEP_ID=MMETSP1439-20131203/26330_1 /TAXON_ID=66791 /ORGANISM="Gonyaulax spinifera, Strain CCMP409" /LENGTH=75 /DNA_ID=CAMNT_0043510377 /DNA_START=57 /DNA_END=281 /DNA_ORIENTATION=+